MKEWLRKVWEVRYNGDFSALAWELALYAFGAIAIGLVVHMFVSAM